MREYLLCLPVVSTFEEEANERKRHTLCFLISKLIETTPVSGDCTDSNEDKDRGEADLPFFDTDLFLQIWRKMLSKLFYLLKR